MINIQRGSSFFPLGSTELTAVCAAQVTFHHQLHSRAASRYVLVVCVCFRLLLLPCVLTARARPPDDTPPRAFSFPIEHVYQK
jgi:hypothetical protein